MHNLVAVSHMLVDPKPLGRWAHTANWGVADPQKHAPSSHMLHTNFGRSWSDRVGVGRVFP